MNAIVMRTWMLYHERRKWLIHKPELDDDGTDDDDDDDIDVDDTQTPQQKLEGVNVRHGPSLK